MRITKRLLWVGGAAYPLQNIARVYTFTLRPKRGEAVTRFMKRVGINAAVLLLALLIQELNRFGSSDEDGIMQFAWTVSLLAFVFYCGDMLSVLLAKSHPVMAIETSGPSTAMVTGRNREHLSELVGSVSHAIENPDTELSVTVGQLLISRPQNYYFGDNVNMYGGQGNTGMVNG
ncbi:DUF6232 family protein [Streptomyces pratensis]|uniref:DUF6232 family protein n=1 Tax=Streptomyces pratensis TaxID=1169025 RepID=UPI0036435252